MSKTSKARISKAWIEVCFDEDPDTSFLGAYTDEYDKWNICCHCGEYVADLAENHPQIERGRKYCYFRPYAGGEKPGTAEYKKYGKQDFKRMESLQAGKWNLIGIIAKAELVSPAGVVQVIRSGGLWGVESDSGEQYINDVKKEQLAGLKDELEALGLGERAIEYALQRAEVAE